VVAIRTRDAERFLSAIPEDIFLFLVYGPDAGMVRERALSIIDKRIDDRRDPFQFVQLSGDVIASDPLLLLDEANTTPLFGGRRAILIETTGKSVLPAINSLIAAPPDACAIVLTAAVLKKDAPLRKLIEGAKCSVAIDCQEDTTQDLNGLIDRTLREAGLTATPEARGLLLNALGEDRLMSRSELAKLVLYMYGRSHVEAADIEAIIAHAASIASDRIVAAAFNGETGAQLETYFAHGGDPSALIFGALRYLIALHKARISMEREGGRLEPGMSVMMRAGFGFMHRGLLESQLKAWTALRINQLREPLRSAQTQARAHAALAQMEAERALWRVAKIARSK